MRNDFDKITTPQLVELRKKFSNQQLADFFGVSKQLIHYRTNRPTTRAYKCSTCGKKFERERRTGRPREEIYCSEKCMPEPVKGEVWRELAKEILE